MSEITVPLIDFPIPVTVDLDKGIKKTYLDQVFATEDNNAHRFDVSLYRGDDPVELPSGVTVNAYFIRYSDNGTLPLTGSVSGSVVSVTLDKACYNKSGAFALIIKVNTGEEITTVFYGEGSVLVSRTDTLIDTENVVPSLEDLLAQIAVMEQATAYATAATQNATQAAADANKAAERANTEADAAQGWAEATATAVTLEAGEDAGVNLSTAESGAKVLEFSIPRGHPGVYIGPEEPTDPTIDVWIDSDGTADGGVTQEEIQEAVNAYLDENHVSAGATAEQAAQIQANTEAIEELKQSGTGSTGMSQALKTAIYNLLMDAVYQSSNHASDRAALEELLTGSAGDDSGGTGGDSGDDSGSTGGEGGDSGDTDTRTILYNWDFTSATPMVDTVSGLEATIKSGTPTTGSTGLVFGASNDSVILTSSPGSMANRDIEIDVASTPTALAASHLRLMVFNANFGAGLICRNTTNNWSIYSGSAWVDGTAAQNTVSGKTILLSFDESENCTVYMDGTEIISAASFTEISQIVLGSTSNSANGITVSGVRIYDREV